MAAAAKAAEPVKQQFRQPKAQYPATLTGGRKESLKFKV
jgi:hypothetical protein